MAQFPLLRFLGRVAAFFLILCSAQASDPVRPDNPRSPFLVLVSRSPADLWAASEVDGILRACGDARPAIVPTIEYLDWQYGETEKLEAQLVSYFSKKFNPKEIRVIVAADDAAVDFLLKYRDRLFPVAEVVACGIEELNEPRQRTWLTGVLEKRDAPGTFRLALQLQPNLEHFFILDDASHLGVQEKARIETACPAEVQRVSIDLLRSETTQILFNEIEPLPANSAILLPRSDISQRVMEELRRRCNVPLYGLIAPMHVHGTVGGSMLDGEEHGAVAARLGLRLLAGASAASLPVVANTPARLVIDYAEAQRLGLAVDHPPSNAEMFNQPPTFWEKHGSVVLTATVVVVGLVITLLTVLELFRQKRRTAAELSRSLSTLHATFDSTSDGVLVVDQRGAVSAYNERFVELWSVPRELALLRDNQRLLVHLTAKITNPGAFTVRIRELYDFPEESSHGELIELCDGRTFERDSRPLRQDSIVTGRVWSYRDVTARLRADEERRRMGDQLAQAQKMEALGNLAGGIAHDFNNILTGVIGYAELAKARLPGRHPAADDLEHVLRASDRAKELVRQILTFSRKRAPEKRPIALDPIVRETLKLLRAVVPASIEIRADLAEDAGLVLADPTQIHQALLNLATNAAHALGSAPGQILVRLQDFEVTPDFAEQHPMLNPGNHLCLSVADTGHGMSRATIARIFEPFFTTKDPGEGTGLGLAVVLAIVQSHDGALEVESEVNIGTTVRVFFPRACDTENRRTGTAHAEPTPMSEGEHVLVVDDEAMITEITRYYLESLGYRVSIANSPEQALEEFLKDPSDFALLLTDFNMPHMNGLELLRRMRSTRPDLRALLCTGYIGSAATEGEAADLGVHEILGKPFTRHTLGSAVHRTLRPRMDVVEELS